MAAPRTILIATTSSGKIREIMAVLNIDRVKIQPLWDLPPLPEPVEDGVTFMDNAVKKARYYSSLTGLWTLADDSGLEVDALDGAPGVISARYSGEPRNDTANNAKLITALAYVPMERRSARFRCALALADGDRILATAEGTIEGRIIDEPRGPNGFGYDPHFIVPELGLTTAELSPERKNRISHRGKALLLLATEIRSIIAGGNDQP